MAQSLQLLRTNPVEGEPPINILSSPDTTIDDFTVNIEFMGENTISAKFYYPDDVAFQLNEYVEYEKEGEPKVIEKYYLREMPIWSKDEKTLMREYECTFLSKGEVLKNVVMLDSWQAAEDGDIVSKPFLYQTEYSFFGGVEEYYLNIKSSMFNEFGYELDDDDVKQPKGWVMVLDLAHDYPQVGDDQIITVSNLTVFDALKDIYTKFKVPFFINGNVLTVGGTKTVVNHLFRYGKDKGLYKINRSNFNDKIITKIRGVGSEKNLPYDYMVKEKADADIEEIPALPMSRLMPYVFRNTLATASAVSDVKDYYISDNYNEEFPNLSFETLDDIFPTIKGVTHNAKRIDKFVGVYFNGTGVSAENSFVINSDNQQAVNPNFWVKIPALGFNLNDCLNEKEALTLVPTNGQCGGCKFNVLSIGVAPDSWTGYNKNAVNDVFSIPKGECNRTNRNSQIIIESNELTLTQGDVVNFSITGDVLLVIYCNYTGGGEVRTSMIAELINITDNTASTITTKYNDLDINGSLSNEAINISQNVTIPNGVISKRYKIRITLDAVVEVSEDIASGARITTNAGNIAVTLNTEQPVYHDTTSEEVWLLLEKDLETYNTLMPYPTEPMWDTFANPVLWEDDKAALKAPSGLVPKTGDEYIFTGISLPDSYIIAAEHRLEDALKALLEESKEYKDKYDCGFDEKMLIENPTIVNSVKVGAVIKVQDSTKPDEIIAPTVYEEVVINNLTLRYTPDKTIGGIN